MVSLFFELLTSEKTKQTFSIFLLITNQPREYRNYSGHFWVLNPVIETRVNLIRYRTHKLIEEEEALVYYQKNIFYLSLKLAEFYNLS